jgi:polyketide synthase 12
VRAAGLNYRDVMIALGVYPGDSPLGSEGAGVVVECAADVGALSVGERVMGLIPDAFGPLAIADSRLLVRTPDEWSDSEAASVPIAFLTACYALEELARLKRGEALLVHGAAGGVGMAALQVAADLGAEVYATAHPEKWQTLRDLGLDDEHIGSSRDLAFRERFMAASGGRGVDVVLDSLAGEFVDASLALLPRGGRFIEMGKTDIRDAEAVEREHAGVSYRAFDLQEAGPERLGAMLSEIVGRFERGSLRHLPIARWDVRRAPAAFRFMRAARHTGKLVLEVRCGFGVGGTVLVTGGLGGLGGLVARRLAEGGVGRLLLVGRGGGGSVGAGELVAELRGLGCVVDVCACDVADRDQLAGVIGSVGGEFPLRGVVHAAGVLEDGVLSSLDGEGLRRVLEPKVDGAINLHELTLGLPLVELIFFSSSVATVGGPGQANYAAANAFLDGLACYRRSLGLPALSLGWGAWERATGMAGALGERDRARFERLGVVPLSDRRGLELFDLARGVDASVLLPVRFDGVALRAQARAGVLPALLRGLVRAPAVRVGDGGGSLVGRLAAAAESERAGIVLGLVCEQVASVLGHASGEAVDPTRGFKELGFDSLGAVELRNRLRPVTGLSLPATLIFDYPTPAALATHLQRKLATAEQPQAVEAREDVVRQAIASIPLSRLQGAGLLEILLELAEPRLANGDAVSVANGEAHTELAAELDIESLIARALEDGTGDGAGAGAA